MNYLIIAESYRIIDDKIAEFCQPDAELIKYDLNINSIEEIIEEAEYYSLLSTKKCIVVYNSENIFKGKLEDKILDRLSTYLEKPSPETTLIFVSGEKDDSRKKTSKILNNQKHVFNYLKMSFTDQANLVRKYLKDKNLRMDSETVNYITKCCHNNYDLICSEIDKFALCFEGNLSLANAQKIISTSLNDNIYKFNDAVIEKNPQAAYKLLKDLKIHKVDPIVILITLAKEFRNMLFYKLANNEGLSGDMLLKKEGLQEWQIKKIANNSRRYTGKELTSIIKTLSLYDYKYKKGIADRSIIMELIMTEIFN